MTTITDARFRTVTSNKPNDRLRAVASVTINGDFVIHDIRIVEGNDHKLFVAMPARKNENDYRDIVHPLSTDVRRRFEAELLEAFERYQATMAAMS